MWPPKNWSSPDEFVISLRGVDVRHEGGVVRGIGQNVGPGQQMMHRFSFLSFEDQGDEEGAKQHWMSRFRRFVEWAYAVVSVEVFGECAVVACLDQGKVSHGDEEIFIRTENPRPSLCRRELSVRVGRIVRQCESRAGQVGK